MNKAFTKSKTIELDSKWYLSPDSDNGVILTFHEIREKEKTKKEDGKLIKTGETEQYRFEDVTYHPRIAQALKEYVKNSLNSSKNLQEIIDKEDKILNIISNLDSTFKQF